jgi:hypothetical protein
VYREFRAGDMHISQADITKAQTLLGYAPLWEVREGMKWALDWYVSTLATSLPVVGDALEKAGRVSPVRAANAKAPVLT